MPRRHLPEEFRFDARYGRLIRKAGIATVPFALFAYQAELALQPQEVWFVSYILAHRWTSDLPFPSLAQMARNSGLTKRALRNYKDSLVLKGFLIVVDRQRADGGTTSHGYDFSPLFDVLDRLITRDLDRWTRRNPQFLEEESTSPEDDDGGTTDPREQVFPPGEGQESPGAGKRPLTGRRKTRTLGPGHATSLQEIEEDRGKRNGKGRTEAKENGSNGVSIEPLISPPVDRPQDLSAGAGPARTTARRGGGDVGQITEYISGVLHDNPASQTATLTRVARLWEASGLGEDKFVAVMREALDRTQRASGNVRRRAGDGSLGWSNKVPYYLRVLENLLEEQGNVAGSVEAGGELPQGGAGRQGAAVSHRSSDNLRETPPGVEFWATALARLREQMTAANFATWLEGTRAIGWEDERLVVAAGDGFTRDWLELRLAPLVRRTIRQLAHPGVDIAFVVETGEETQ